jgi:hypothetical protein
MTYMEIKLGKVLSYKICPRYSADRILYDQSHILLISKLFSNLDEQLTSRLRRNLNIRISYSIQNDLLPK